jgi:enoyl-CoA hydratase
MLAHPQVANMSIHIHTQDRVTTVLIDRPHARNAVDGPTATALHRAFVAFDTDPAADVAVLAGSGGTFCAGADLKALADGIGPESLANPLNTDMQAVGPMGPTRLCLSKPVIAAVSGYAVAGGLELALWCDMRVMDEDAQFGVFCRRWGVPLIDGGTVRLPRLIGHARAMDLILTGRAVTAQEALAIGLANRIVPAGQALLAAQALAREIAAFPQTCLRSDRASAMAQWGLEQDAAMAQEFAKGLATLRSSEGTAGAARFSAGAGRHGAFGQ